MGLFEANPYLLVPVILSVVVAYDITKWLVLRALGHRRSGQGLHFEN